MQSIGYYETLQNLLKRGKTETEGKVKHQNYKGGH